MDELSQLKNIMSASTKLIQANDFAAALALLDEAIAEAVRQAWPRSVTTLCSRAAVICHFSDNLPLRRHYYELSLLHNPRDYRALYDFARVLLDEGQIELARQYAKQAHEAILASDDPIAARWLGLMKIRWPDIVGSSKS